MPGKAELCNDLKAYPSTSHRHWKSSPHQQPKQSVIAAQNSNKSKAWAKLGCLFTRRSLESTVSTAAKTLTDIKLLWQISK
jgi:hypothetical protein